VARFLQFPAPGPESCPALPSATQRYTPRVRRYLKLYRRRKPERMQNCPQIPNPVEGSRTWPRSLDGAKTAA
jgi:hypothetical protein